MVMVTLTGRTPRKSFFQYKIISGKIRERGLNFVTCEQILTLIDVRTYLVIDDESLVGDAEVCVED